MRAALYSRHGPAHDVLRIVDVPDPEPSDGEVRVRLQLAAVNPTDWRARSGDNGSPLPFPQQIPGQDGAGVIDAVGAGVDRSRVGEGVWVYHAAHGRPGGTAAELVTVPSARAVALPEGVSWEQACALGIPYLTAHRALLADGPVRGRHVLVAGGGGAVGQAALQLGRWLGARMAATASTERKAELARAGGAEVVAYYRRPDEAAATLRSWAPAGVARIVEVALASNLELDLRILAPGGTIVSYARDQEDVVVPILPFMRGNASLRFLLVYGTPEPALEEAVTDVTAALAAHVLRPMPSRTYPLSQVADAHAEVEAGTDVKVLLDVSR